jgi:hypothetical protein
MSSQVWNRNAKTGVLAAFNLQAASWDPRRRCAQRRWGRVPSVCTRISPMDVEGLVVGPASESLFVALTSRWASDGRLLTRCDASWRGAGRPRAGRAPGADGDRVALPSPDGVFCGSRVDELDGDGEFWLKLDSQDASVTTFAPLQAAQRERDGVQVSWAALGLEELLNGGGALTHVSSEGGRVVVRVRGAGTLLVYCSKKPVHVRVGWEDAGFSWEEERLLVRVPLSALEKGTVDVMFRF